MDRLKVAFTNCYGIQKLEEELDFNSGVSNSKAKAFAIYAPNGTMKTSFAKVFDAVAHGEKPKDERFGKQATCKILADGIPINSESIYVLHSEIDIKKESEAITNILVHPQSKARYDKLIIELDKLKDTLINSLQKISKVKKKDIEQELLNIWSLSSFRECIESAIEDPVEADLKQYVYSTIFNQKSQEVLESEEFIARAKEFNDRYQQIFECKGTIYAKGVFNLAKAETSFNTLSKQGFFKGGHLVKLNGEIEAIGEEELFAKHNEFLNIIDSDDDLKKLRTSLASNMQTQALVDLIESLSNVEVEYLLDNLKPEKKKKFQKDIWNYYINSGTDAKIYIDAYRTSETELCIIEEEATKLTPQWLQTIDLFNDRFIDMPFVLSISNQKEVGLGKERASLQFVFRDGENRFQCSQSELKTLSQGEERALYLLNLIFEIEYRKVQKQETLFIFDDIADSFDYKNKHAIVQYLKDLTHEDYFHQIILTHNYDFFRTLATTFVHRKRCLMTIKTDTAIILKQGKGVKNYFIGEWRDKIDSCESILCATIPFTRNLIEYTKGEEDIDYKTLSNMIHWRKETDSITVGDYYKIYNNLFGKNYPGNNTQSISELIFNTAVDICKETEYEGLDLEHKVVLCIAIRLYAEKFVIDGFRKQMGIPEYWPEPKAFGKMLDEFKSLTTSANTLKTLEKVSITVSSNIHLNSFMYEPIIDLSIEHLVKLHNEVAVLS